MVPKHQIRAVLFDLDGVVVFTDKYHYLAWKRLSDEQGWEFDEKVNQRLRGIPRMASLEQILLHNKVRLPDDEKVRLAKQKNEYYKQLLEQIDETALYPGAIDLLRALKEEGTLLGLCSSSRNAQTVLDKLGLTEWFDVVVTGHDITRAKPDPQIFLLAAEQLRVPAFHCLVFEDAASGVESALAAGMKCIGVGTRENLPDAPEVITDYNTIDVSALLDTARPGMPAAEPWTLAETAVSPGRSQYWESLLALSNGYMGLRGTSEDDDASTTAYPGMFINGVYDYRPYHYEWAFPGFPERGHAMANLCDWRIIRLFVDDRRFSLSEGEVSDYRRELDLRRGVVTRSLTWQSPAGRRVSVRTTRLVSMTRPHSAAIRYEVTPLDDECEVRIESVFRGEAESQVLPGKHTEVTQRKQAEQAQGFEIRTLTAPFRIGAAFAHRLSGLEQNGPPTGDGSEEAPFTQAFQARSPAGQPVVLDKHACFHTSIETPGEDVLDAALSGVAADSTAGFDELLREQEAFWAEHWKLADVEIDGNPRDQQMARLSLFHLRQSLPSDGTRSIGANGLTGDKYCGHVFWDTEMYVSPYFLYTRPESVRPLVDYRYNILGQARQRAREMQGVGALYSWNSISGEECGIVYEAATAEYHLLCAIAFAIDRYVRQTGDDDFLFERGAEILFETARFLVDRGAYVPMKGDRFCINAVCGPDEYGCAVNNNCYTNMMAQWHFRYAHEVFERMRSEKPDQLAALAERIDLAEAEPSAWLEAAERIYVPYSEQLGVHAQDDSFLYLDPVDMGQVPRNTDIRDLKHPLNLWRMQVAKQADVVLLMFVLGEQFSLDQKRANYEYYEPKTCHGSSLSACIHSIMASEIGKPADAYAYFRESAAMDVNDFKNNTSAGVHSACLGGTWMAVVNGFAGMRDYADGLHLAPRLPEAWNAYRFHLNYRGRVIRVDIDASGATYRLISGEALSFDSARTEVSLTPDAPDAHCALATD
jgi:alpha,alpha-trehalose phosphorylase